MPQKKRGKAEHGSGSVVRQRKDGRFYSNITVNGKLKTIYGKTRPEVAEKKRAIVAAIDEQTYIEPHKMKLKKWIALWLRDYCGHLKPETARKYESDTRLHIIPYLGEINLMDLNPIHVQTFVNHLILSPHSIRNVHGTLSKCLSEAVRIGAIRSNPCALTKLPKGRKPEITPLQGEEITDFLAALRGSEDEQLFFTALWTGMRLSELLGLQWKCVNFEAGTIRVKLQLEWNRGSGERNLTTLKNHKERTITPPQSVMEALRREKVRQRQYRLLTGGEWDNPLDLVFTSLIGAPLVQGTIEKHIQKIYRKIGVRGRVFHDLRHTFATESLRLGTPIKTVSEMLGHSSVAFTMDVYAGYTPVMQQESANRLQAEINRLKIRDA